MSGLWQSIKKRQQRKSAAKAWQSAIVRLVRTPSPYEMGWFEDTFESRTQVMAVMTVLVMRRLRTAPGGDKLARAVYNGAFSSIDAALREQGVGDASIARKIRGIGEAFVGLARSFGAALEAEKDEEIKAVLVRNGVCKQERAPAVLLWLKQIEGALGELPDEEVHAASTIGGFTAPETV